MTRFWQYKVYADIRGGSQDLCTFFLDLRMPVSIYYTDAVLVFKITSMVDNSLATNRAAANTRV